MRVSKSDAGLYYKYVCPVGLLHLLMGRAWLGADLPVLREWGEHLDSHFALRPLRDCGDLRGARCKRSDYKINVGAQYSALPPPPRSATSLRWAASCPWFDLDLDESGLGLTADDLEGCVDALFPLVAAGLGSRARRCLRRSVRLPARVVCLLRRRGARTLGVRRARPRTVQRGTRRSLARLRGTGAPPGERPPPLPAGDHRLDAASGRLDAPRLLQGEAGRAPGLAGRAWPARRARAQQANFLRMVGAPSLNTETLAGPKFLKRLYRACSTNPAAMERLSMPYSRLWRGWTRACPIDMKHLLKAPFSLHPKAGRVSLRARRHTRLRARASLPNRCRTDRGGDSA